MFRFSVALTAALAVITATTISISPASAVSGPKYDQCMAKCMKERPTAKTCPAYCDKAN
ncbi:hypothetical protein SAMN05444170_6531 [Bradyrhizobium erythrophlei]|jgi:hypothetical protein|uniref:PsiF repeat-containing protein n=1 Tax=Bradyrhizobium erythrophlei TaxID=1437360 RepID=A0A1M7USW4_9BRAD|nr:hypothetical protein SAMN05444170_6531 [Bradyrhizobium erythrophlei]